MAKMTKISGVQEVLKNLKDVKAESVDAMIRGLVKAGLFLQRKSQQIVPVDTGALKNSAFTRKVGTGKKTDVVVGYTQSYAIYVHENLNARHAKGKTAKFLERPARLYRKQMVKIVSDEIAKALKKKRKK